MPILTDAELNESLGRLLLSFPSWYSDLPIICKALFVTGCRPIEILEIARWHETVPNTFVVQTAKKNNNREVHNVKLLNDYIDIVRNGYAPFSLLSLRKFDYQFQKCYEYPTASIGDKNVGLYLFRHNRIKQLHLAGATIAEIKLFTGQKTDSVVEGYIDSVIEY